MWGSNTKEASGVEETLRFGRVETKNQEEKNILAEDDVFLLAPNDDSISAWAKSCR